MAFLSVIKSHIGSVSMLLFAKNTVCTLYDSLILIEKLEPANGASA